jgi:hypothetical protein
MEVKRLMLVSISQTKIYLTRNFTNFDNFQHALYHGIKDLTANTINDKNGDKTVNVGVGGYLSTSEIFQTLKNFQHRHELQITRT